MRSIRLGLFRGKRREDPRWSTPIPAKDLMPDETSEETILGSDAGYFRLVLDRYPLEGAVAPDGLHVEVVERSGRSVLLLSGGDPDAASHSLTGGFSIRVSDSFESAVSGRRVRVKISARAAQGLADAEFSVAYSTNDVGNSGWKSHSVGNQFETLSFEWDVPTMVNGNGDYVGILPGQVGAIEVAGLTVFAISRE